MGKIAYISIIFFFLSYNNCTSYIFGQNVQNKPEPSIENRFTHQQWIEDIDYLVKRLEIAHPGLYANVSKEKFNKFADELRVKAQTASEAEMYFGITELINMIQDHHTWISWGEKDFKRFLHLPPISVYMFSDGLFITAAINKYSNIVSKKIIKVGNVTTEEFMNRRLRTRSGENKWNGLACIDLFIEELYYLNVLQPNEKLKLTLEDVSHNISEVEIESVPLREYFPRANKLIFPLNDSLITTMNGGSTNPRPFWLPWLDSTKNINDRYWFKYLPEQEAIYIRINECYNKDNDPFDKFNQRMFKTLDGNNAKCLIMDVRNNSGGNHLEQPLILGIIERPNINKPDKLFLITDRFVGSASQHMVTQLIRYTNITTFGEPTGAKPNFYGSHQEFDLPNSTICIGHSIKFWQDAGPNDFRTTTEPDIFVPYNSTDYRDNHDPVLEQIFKYDSFKNLRPEFTEKMIKAYNDSGIDNVKKVYADIKSGYVEYGFNMQNLLYSDFGGWLSDNAKSNEDYINYLRFLCQELPNSVAVCWDLANWLNGPEHQEERITLYKKCLEINPAHYLAKMRLNLIELEEATQSKIKSK
jgi:hypothetical protein